MTKLLKIIRSHVFPTLCAIIITIESILAGKPFYYPLFVIICQAITVVLEFTPIQKSYHQFGRLANSLTQIAFLLHTGPLSPLLVLALCQLIHLQGKLMKNPSAQLFLHIVASTYLMLQLGLEDPTLLYLPAIFTLFFVVHITFPVRKSRRQSPETSTPREPFPVVKILEGNGHQYTPSSYENAFHYNQCQLLNLFPQGIALYSLNDHNLHLCYSNHNILKLLRASSEQDILQMLASLEHQYIVESQPGEQLNDDRQSEKTRENKASISSYSTFQPAYVPANLTRSQKRTLTNNNPRPETPQFKRMSSQFTYSNVAKPDLHKQDSLMTEESLIEQEVKRASIFLEKSDSQALFRESGTYIHEFQKIVGRNYDQKNKKRTLELHIYCCLLNDQLMLLFILRDVTHRDYISALKEYSKQKSMTLTFVSHEYRTPLSQIITMLESRLEEEAKQMSQTVILQRDALRKTKLPMRVSKYTKIALDNARHLLSISEDLLDLAQMKVGKFQIQKKRFNLQVLFEHCLDLFMVTADLKNIKLLLSYDKNAPASVVSDEKRIKQIMINLLGNAFKFTKEGQVTVKVIALGNERLEISVNDTGVGIADEDQTKLFQAFGKGNSDEHKQLNMQGVGLGLLISNQIIQNLNQDLQNGLKFASKLGVGSSFYFQLTYKDSKDIDSLNSLDERNLESEESMNNQLECPSRSQVHKVKVEQHSFKKRSTKAIISTPILIVDDGPINIEALKAYLRRCGIDCVDSSGDGLGAIEMVKSKWQISHDFYRIIFMDLDMPRMNGFQATKHILEIAKSMGIEVSIIGCSAHYGAEQDCLNSGMKGCISKPVQPDKLRRLLQQYL